MTDRKYEDLFPEEWYELNPDIEDRMGELLTNIKPKRAYVPRGYTLNKELKVCEPVPEILINLIELLIDFKIHNSRSLRETQEMIMAVERANGVEDPGIISLGGVTQLFYRLEKDLGISLKESTQDRIQRKRQERTAKAREEGKKRPYAYSSKVKAKLEIQKKLTHTNRELKELAKEKVRLQRKASRNARRLKLKDYPTK